MQFVKKIIRKTLGPDIGKKIRRVGHFFCTRKKKVNSSLKINILSSGCHTSCGYYDLDPVQNGKMLFISTDESMKKAVVSQYNLDTKLVEELDTGNVANWQQGNRLRWIEKDGYIFNSFENKKYISVEHINNIRKIHKWPIYDVSHGKAVTLDFNRLGWMRPGYGYTEYPLAKIKENDTAIKLFNLEDDNEIVNITYADLMESLGKKVDLQKCYVNHLKFSPKGDSFLFFFIEIVNNRHMCYLGVFYENKLRFIEKDLCASHYTWKNENEILTTSYDDKHICGYYIYSLTEGHRTQIMCQLLNKDGHPTYYDDKYLVTDTYPDAAGFQRILLVDIANERINECVSIYSSAKHVGVERCDLHPRISKETNEVYFDADIDGHRRVYSFSLLEALENEA